MFILRRGCCGQSLRSNVLVVLYINAIINFLYVGRISSTHDVIGLPSYIYTIFMLVALANAIVSGIIIVKEPENSLFWLKAFVYVKIVEIICNIRSVSQMIDISYFSIVWYSLNNIISVPNIHDMEPAAYLLCAYIFYSTIITSMIVFTVCFALIVYSYLVETEERKNSLLSAVGDPVSQSDSFYHPVPPYIAPEADDLSLPLKY